MIMKTNLGDFGEAGGGDDVDSLLVVPDVLGVQLYDDAEWYLCRDRVAVLQHAVHEILQRLKGIKVPNLDFLTD